MVTQQLIRPLCISQIHWHQLQTLKHYGFGFSPRGKGPIWNQSSSDLCWITYVEQGSIRSFSDVPCHQCTTFSTAVRSCSSGFQGPAALHNSTWCVFLTRTYSTTFILQPSGLRHSKIVHDCTKLCNTVYYAVLLTMNNQILSKHVEQTKNCGMKIDYKNCASRWPLTHSRDLSSQFYPIPSVSPFI